MYNNNTYRPHLHHASVLQSHLNFVPLGYSSPSSQSLSHSAPPAPPAIKPYYTISRLLQGVEMGSSASRSPEGNANKSSAAAAQTLVAPTGTALSSQPEPQLCPAVSADANDLMGPPSRPPLRSQQQESHAAAAAQAPASRPAPIPVAHYHRITVPMGSKTRPPIANYAVEVVPVPAAPMGGRAQGSVGAAAGGQSPQSRPRAQQYASHQQRPNLGQVELRRRDPVLRAQYAAAIQQQRSRSQSSSQAPQQQQQQQKKKRAHSDETENQQQQKEQKRARKGDSQQQQQQQQHTSSVPSQHHQNQHAPAQQHHQKFEASQQQQQQAQQQQCAQNHHQAQHQHAQKQQTPYAQTAQQQQQQAQQQQYAQQYYHQQQQLQYAQYAQQAQQHQHAQHQHQQHSQPLNRMQYLTSLYQIPARSPGGTPLISVSRPPRTLQRLPRDLPTMDPCQLQLPPPPTHPGHLPHPYAPHPSTVPAPSLPLSKALARANQVRWREGWRPSPEWQRPNCLGPRRSAGSMLPQPEPDADVVMRIPASRFPMPRHAWWDEGGAGNFRIRKEVKWDEGLERYARGCLDGIVKDEDEDEKMNVDNEEEL